MRDGRQRWQSQTSGLDCESDHSRMSAGRTAGERSVATNRRRKESLGATFSSHSRNHSSGDQIINRRDGLRRKPEPPYDLA
jgi:hypothetical protein